MAGWACSYSIPHCPGWDGVCIVSSTAAQWGKLLHTFIIIIIIDTGVWCHYLLHVCVWCMYVCILCHSLFIVFLYRDTAGQERFHTITTSYYRGAMVCTSEREEWMREGGGEREGGERERAGAIPYMEGWSHDRQWQCCVIVSLWNIFCPLSYRVIHVESVVTCSAIDKL